MKALRYDAQRARPVRASAGRSPESQDMLRKQLLVAALLATAFFVGATAHADSAQPSATDVAAFRNYTLTTSFLEKWKAVAEDPKAPQCNLTTLTLHGKSLDAMVREYDQRPGVHASLESHGLTAREVILATSTLTAAGIQDVREKHPGIAAQGISAQSVSAANMAFYRAHHDELHQLMQRIAQQRLHAEGGKGTVCPD
jgi:hypothetical protein